MEVNRLAFYKEKNMEFQLMNLNMVEEYVVWKKYGLTEDVLGSDGTPLVFPIKTGELKGMDGTPRDVLNVMKYMKKADFEAQYPKLQRSTKYVRDISVAGTVYNYRFGKTSNDHINTLINMATSMGQNATSLTFVQTFDKNQAPINMYKVIIRGTAQSVAPPVINSYQGVNVVAPQVPPTPQQMPIAPPVPVKPEIKLTELEKEFLDAMKSLGDKKEESAFIALAKSNKIEQERAEIMFKYLY